MKVITLEEHFADPAIGQASAGAAQSTSPGYARTFLHPAPGTPYTPDPFAMADIGQRRIAEMDRYGISMQVLSCLSTQQLPANTAPGLVRSVNDRLAAAVRAHPDRFAGFASLPTSAPEAAADEIRRARTELGLVATMIFGRTDGDFLSAPRFAPMLDAIAETATPIYLHPAPPPRTVFDSDYALTDDVTATLLSTAGWGWHNETAVHFLHLALGGVFDHHPDLQIVLGHWGELLPVFINRLDDALPQRITGLNRPMSDYLRHNTYVTPSGIWTQAALQLCISLLGIDRIMYAVDYPFIELDHAVEFLEHADLSSEHRELIAHGNAERLLRLGARD